MDDNEITSKIIGSAIKVHKKIGPGVFENVYKECMFYELKKEGFKVQKEVLLPIKYDDLHLEYGYRIDILVEGRIILELKTVEYLNDKHLAQILTYLRLSENKLGLLINFNEPLLKNGIKRVVNHYS
jgi:GxxExxY protein